MYVRNGTGVLKKVLVSKPVYLEAAPINEIARKWEKVPLDKEKMRKEHEEFVSAYREAGVEVEYLEADPQRPNAVFSRDFGGCVKEGYILGNFKLPLRYKEQADYERRMAELGIPMIARCREGLFEGGDFAFLREDWIAVGMADRTDRAGLLELKTQLEPLGYRVTGVPLKASYLHLDMCFNLVDDHLAVAYKEGLTEEFLQQLAKEEIEILPVKEEAIFRHGCNLQALGRHRVMSLAGNQEVNEALVKKGMEVIALNVSEILKAGGGPHCMTFPLCRE